MKLFFSMMMLCAPLWAGGGQSTPAYDADPMQAWETTHGHPSTPVRRAEDRTQVWVSGQQARVVRAGLVPVTWAPPTDDGLGALEASGHPPENGVWAPIGEIPFGGPGQWELPWAQDTGGAAAEELGVTSPGGRRAPSGIFSEGMHAQVADWLDEGELGPADLETPGVPLTWPCRSTFISEADPLHPFVERGWLSRVFNRWTLWYDFSHWGSLHMMLLDPVRALLAAPGKVKRKPFRAWRRQIQMALGCQKEAIQAMHPQLTDDDFEAMRMLWLLLARKRGEWMRVV